MLGRIRWGEVRKVRIEEERLMGLPVLALTLPTEARRRERAARKGLSMLSGQRVGRVLLPADWDLWPLLRQYGLRGVETGGFRCALAPTWVDAVLRGKGLSPERAVLVLSGERESSSMCRVARVLCPLVRNLVIDVPGEGELSKQLRWEFGLPVLGTRGIRADARLFFAPDPVLHGCAVGIKTKELLPSDCDSMSLLCVLWENQRIKIEDVVLKADFS